MAWYKRYQIPFKSLDRVTQYMVYILEQTDGSLVTLQGADAPFETQEDSNDSIFTPFRDQTGTLRVIDNTPDGNLLATLMPKTNTEKQVRLVRGTWDSSMTTFTDGITLWTGYLCAEAFTQPWENVAKVVEFPVKSMLAALDDIEIPVNLASQDVRIAKLFESALDAVGIFPGYFVIGGLTAPVDDFLMAYVQMPAFFTEEEINNQGDSFQQLIGNSYKSALSSIMQLYGLCLRESGNILYMVKYDTPGYNDSLTLAAFTAAQFRLIAAGTTQTPYPGEISSLNLLETVKFVSNHSINGFLQGARSAQVILDVIDKLSLHINLPQTTEDSSTVDVVTVTNGSVKVQPHAPRVNNIETYQFWEYNNSTLISSSNYADCLNNTVIFNPGFDPHLTSGEHGGHLHTGAFPCRWSHQASPGQSPILKNGLFLNQQYLYAGYNFPADYIYIIKSALPYTLRDGYININLNCYNFDRGYFLFNDYDLTFGEYLTQGTKPLTKLQFVLKWGTKMWNGTEWIVPTGNDQSFVIDFDGVAIKSNKTSDMQVEGSQGWFIPVPDEMSGIISLGIINVASCLGYTGYNDAHSRIISDLVVEFLPSINITASQRGENIYRQTILESGFSGDKAISLNVGTINNNIISTCFLKNKNLEYMQIVRFEHDDNPDGVRPELYLLQRMVQHYGKVRQTLQATLKHGVDVYERRYQYAGRQYMAIDYKHNWRDNNQEVKFIEVVDNGN